MTLTATIANAARQEIVSRFLMILKLDPGNSNTFIALPRCSTHQNTHFRRLPIGDIAGWQPARPIPARAPTARLIPACGNATGAAHKIIQRAEGPVYPEPPVNCSCSDIPTPTHARYLHHNHERLRYRTKFPHSYVRPCISTEAGRRIDWFQSSLSYPHFPASRSAHRHATRPDNFSQLLP